MLSVQTEFTLDEDQRLCAFHSLERETLRASCCWVLDEIRVQLCDSVGGVNQDNPMA